MIAPTTTSSKSTQQTPETMSAKVFMPELRRGE
jgi:hypothetical protein